MLDVVHVVVHSPPKQVDRQWFRADHLHEMIFHGEFDDILYPNGAPKSRMLPAGMRMAESSGRSFSEPWRHH